MQRNIINQKENYIQKIQDIKIFNIIISFLDEKSLSIFKPILKKYIPNKKVYKKVIKDTIYDLFVKGEIDFNDQIYITNIRQKEAIRSAKISIDRTLESIENNMPEDFYSIDIMDAYESLGTVIGETLGEDLVDEIFSKFCMGK